MPPDEPDHLVDVHDAAAYIARLRGQPCAPGTIRSAATRGHIARHGRRRGRTMYDLRELHRWAMMGTMDDLITWLRAQLDEDERVARAAILAMSDTGEWTTRDIGGPALPSVWQGTARVAHELADEHAEHIALWDPARVLAEVKAKRAILDLHEPWPSHYIDRTYVHDQPGELQCDHCRSLCHSGSGLSCDQPDAPWPCPTVRLLAQSYADRQGSREEWQPELDSR